jgi:hypothetical protein
MQKKTKVSKTQGKPNFGYTVLATVPYQKCPVCGGMGQIFVNQLDPYNTTSSIGYKPCQVCVGNGIIPMHIVNEGLLKISSKNYGEDGVGLSSEEISKLL